MTSHNTAARNAADPFVLIDDSQTPDGKHYLFENPKEIIQCDSPTQVAPALSRIEAACDSGLYAAGFFAYELGYVLEPKLSPLLPEYRTQPLLWVGLFDPPCNPSHEQTTNWLQREAVEAAEASKIRSSLDQDSYRKAFEQVQRYISAGDLYQVNLTLKQQFQVTGDPAHLYRQLRIRQPVAHGGLLRGTDFHVLSLSPELFIDISDGNMVMRPMKGTAARGTSAAADTARREHLHADAKNRAENLMIVDLMRNDMSRIARTGSVHVPELFTVETYPTLHQMTSTVRGQLRDNLTLVDLLRGLFPCGSITGAPKIRAMEVIRELETVPRGIYTGSLGFIGPNHRIHLNVAIRTLHVDAAGQGEMGIGSGIVADSDAHEEYQECLLKARFLEQATQTADMPSETVDVSYGTAPARTEPSCR